MEFEELTPRAQRAALSEYGEPPDDWHVDIYERAREDVRERGFHIEDIRFSGFHSQGDGASWTGVVDLLEFLEYHLKPEHPKYAQLLVLTELIRNLWADKWMNIKRHSFYYAHSGTMTSEGFNHDLDYEDEPIALELGILEGADAKTLIDSIDATWLIQEVEEWVLDAAKDYADTIYKQLREEYEHYTSEEYFKELIYINGWRFDSTGKLIQE
jgi:hypothetical protein